MLKKIALAALLSASALAAHAAELKIGASNVPHAEILEEAAPLLKEKGVDLTIIPFQDYILPNTALANEEIDANYFQHIPYLNEVLSQNPSYKFVNAGAIHIEPIGIYSKGVKSLKDLPDGAKIVIRDAVADQGRILSIFEREGVLKLKDGVEKTSATIDDIVENPKNIDFSTQIEAALLPQAYQNEEGDAVVINANYALGAGIDPVNEPIAVESGENNPYANIITVREGDENKPEIKELIAVLHSKQIQDWIKEKYKGAVLPVSE
ncbi:MetQ/NlpA family ABC transporter substrate-binding protein [Limoniibacter endophyticus]|uniref:Lipoprotein n=1 Tax=Limoniibacter endophyticus TaxID=1565040 RepID=A0A8J3DH93_9HYPH|nr:MetQ/NlpA family ABC transporter substrate-binding protein [Limoniibacter endophyticus]GHC67520.1 lipoprotein [Limoniibacter endophyticus]